MTACASGVSEEGAQLGAFSLGVILGQRVAVGDGKGEVQEVGKPVLLVY